MSDTRNHTTRDQLAAVIAAHSYTYPDSFCSCHAFVTHATYATHLADALLASDAIAAVRAAAVAETTAAIEATLRDDPVFGELGGAISAAVEGLPASLPEPGPPVTVERCYATGFAAPVIAAVSTHLRAALSGGRTALDTRLAQARAEGYDRGLDDYREGWREGKCRHIIPANPYREGASKCDAALTDSRTCQLTAGETCACRADTGADQ